MQYGRFLFLLSLFLLSGRVGVQAHDSIGPFPSPKHDESILSASRTEDGLLRASLSILPRHVRISDTVFLTLRIDYNKTVRPLIPDFGDALGDFDILAIEQRVAVEGGAERSVRDFILTLVPQRTGTINVWPLPLHYAVPRTGEDDEIRTFVLPACRIDVSSPFASERISLNDIVAPPQPLAFDSASRLPAMLTGAAALTVGTIALILLLRHRRRRNAGGPLPVLGPEEIARERLRQLVESKWHESDVRRFYIELTAIVRWYVEQVMDIRAPEQTTEEFLREISSSEERFPRFGPKTRERLRQFLHDADLVKFAKVRPSPEEIMSGYHSACRFVSREGEQKKAGGD